MSARCSEVGTRCNEQARFSDSLMLRALATASVGLAATSKLGLRIVNFALRFVIWLIETGSTHCSEYGSHYNKLAQVEKPQILKFVVAASLVVTTTSLLFRCSETFSCHNERPLLCDILMCDINVEMLCQYDNVCLVRIDSYENLMNNVHVGTPAQAYT